MSGVPAFAAFERGLKRDQDAEESHKLEVLGIEPPPEKRRGGPKPKPQSEKLPPLQRHMIGVLPDLYQQIEQVARALDSEPLAVARMILGAGVDAVVRELESEAKITIPLRLNVGKEARGYYYQWVRTVTPERFECLRHLRADRLERWRQSRNPEDKTGTPMPPPTLSVKDA